MSRENAEEVARRWLGAFGDDPQGFRALLHPDLVWFPFEDNHMPSHGIEGAMRTRNHWLESWTDMRAEVEEVVGESDGVVATLHVTARGKTSGVAVDVRLFMHFKVQDNKVVYVYEYDDRDEALEAVGLRE